MLFALLACDIAGNPQGSIDTSRLFPANEDRFQAYRNQTEAEYTDPELADTLDETDLLLSRFAATGCGGDAWRVELRTGSEWATATAAGAFHFDDSSGLSLCGWEDASGTLATYDPPVLLWDNGTPLEEGEALTSGSWTATPAREEAVATYFGTFPKAVGFTLAGDGALDGWKLHFADDNGLVLMQGPDLTADLVYSR